MRPLQTIIPVYFGLVFISLLPLQELKAQQSFYDFSVEDVHGFVYDLAQLQGKKVLVVNTASGCALTPQYEGLESLYREYGGNDFIILAFPSNDFGKQEPGSNKEIAAFCKTEYEISFPVMSKILVKGEEKHPLYHWLTEASENGLEDSKVSWNFQKYMINEEGHLVGHVAPWRKPDCKKIISWLKEEAPTEL